MDIQRGGLRGSASPRGRFRHLRRPEGEWIRLISGFCSQVQRNKQVACCSHPCLLEATLVFKWKSIFTKQGLVFHLLAFWGHQMKPEAAAEQDLLISVSSNLTALKVECAHRRVLITLGAKCWLPCVHFYTDSGAGSVWVLTTEGALPISPSPHPACRVCGGAWILSF